MTALNTFGAVLAHAIAIESALHVFYQQMGDAQRAKDADKRKQKMERVRRENVVEITLEPIEGLHAADYTLDTSAQTTEAQRLAEQTAARFYRDAAPKMNVLAVQRAFERCAQEHVALS
jgi:rubrerythrin